MRIGDFGMRIGDCGLRVKAVYNAFRGSWSDFLGAVGVSVVSGYFRGLYAICGDCGSAIAECGL